MGNVGSGWHERLRRAAEATKRRRLPLGHLSGVGAPIVLAACLVPARTSFAPSAAALLFVALIVAVAVLGSRLSGFIASVSCGLWFDFFLTRPYERFAISQRADLETTISLFVVGIIVTELAARSRHHRQVAVQEADHVAVIHELSEMVSLGVPAARVVEAATDQLVELLQLRRCRFESGPPAQNRTTVMSDGEVVHGGFLWGVCAMGLPGSEVDLPIHYAGKVLGRFVMVPTPGWPVPLEKMIVAVAIAGQSGAALATRARIA
jgi:K+-sensing histidine kinase KdpD